MELNCAYKNVDWENFGSVYTCYINSAKITEPETKVITFKGGHLFCPDIKNYYTNEYVEAIWFKDALVEYFPVDIAKTFTDLKIFSIENCGLKTISQKDLIEIPNIQCLLLASNKLTTLQNDLFAKMRNLRMISFNNNQIDCFDIEVIKPIQNVLESFYFEDNPNISAAFNNKKPNTMKNFLKTMQHINDSNVSNTRANESVSKLNVVSAKLESISTRFEKLFVSSKFSDFTIKVRDKEYKVHKCILAPQSSVFDEMFTSEAEEGMQVFKKIADFNENAFEDFLRFFYTKKIQFEENVNEVLQLATEFNVPELTKVCSEIVLKDFDDSMGLKVYNLGHSHASEEMKKAGFEAIKRTYPEFGELLLDIPVAVNMMIAAKLMFEQSVAENENAAQNEI